MPNEKMPFKDFIEYCIGEDATNTGLRAQPPCWHFEYEHISGSLYLHKAIVCLPIEDTNEFMHKLTRDCYKLEYKLKLPNKPKNPEDEEEQRKKLSGDIIYQKIESYQIPIPDSDMKKSANEIEIRMLEDLDLDYGQYMIDKEKFSFETEVKDV